METYSVLQMLFNECNSTNQSVKVCWLHMARKPFLSKLLSLAYFNHCVLFAFLYTWLKNTQNLSYIYHKLCQVNLSTLNEYVVNMREVQVQNPNEVNYLSVFLK